MRLGDRRLPSMRIDTQAARAAGLYDYDLEVQGSSAPFSVHTWCLEALYQPLSVFSSGQSSVPFVLPQLPGFHRGLRDRCASIRGLTRPARWSAATLKTARTKIKRFVSSPRSRDLREIQNWCVSN